MRLISLASYLRRPHQKQNKLAITKESDPLGNSLKILDYLEAKGLVQSCLRGADSSSWKMTHLGVASLCIAVNEPPVIGLSMSSSTLAMELGKECSQVA